jgi:peptidoglycan hydrolase-like protein with peptidoglycan-binding domain
MKLSLLLLGLVAVSPVAAQTRVTVPTGTVLLVRTEQPLESANAQVGQTFNTTLMDDVSVNGYTVIPNRSRIRGVVSFVQPATRRQSGVMEVTFDRLTLPGGGSFAMAGKLTSTDSTERRQIDARSDPHVVLIGERGGGAAIAGAGNKNSPTSSILGALASVLSAGTNVALPAGTTLAVQLEQGLTLNVSGAADLSDESTIFTVSERIRAAQQALARRAYYRGAPTGVLDNATRRALFEFQLDNNINATGNLDRRTAAALGILGGAGGTTGAGGVLSAQDAQVLRRAAQAMEARQRQNLATDADVDLYFAVSAFADNSSLYEQFVQANANSSTAVMAGRALLNAARRVDTAMQSARTSQQVRNQWNSIRRQLQTLDQNYR